MQRARLIQAASALVVAVITASEEYRVLMRACDAFSVIWYERIGVITTFALFYAAAAYFLLYPALTSRLPARSWSRSLLTFTLAICFGAAALISAPSAFAALNIAAGAGYDAVLRSSFGMAATELASYPNLAGAILGAFFFQTIAIVVQELQARGHMRLIPR